MKIKSVISIVVVATAYAGLSSSALAQPQPRPAPPLGVRPAPPLGVRPAPPVGVDSHHDEHEREEHHDETEAQLRDRLQREHDADYQRRQAMRRNQAAWDAAREQRAIDARNQINATWGGIAERSDARAEFTTHADRMAQLNRILDVALDKGDTALAAHCRNVIQREIARDARILANIRANAGTR